jgi:sugar/nucleoside kinase (ribokinase family)
VVDTLGAGDVLHGAAAAALARGLGIESALDQGVRVASESVRHPGALGWVAARA